MRDGRKTGSRNAAGKSKLKTSGTNWFTLLRVSRNLLGNLTKNHFAIIFQQARAGEGHCTLNHIQALKYARGNVLVPRIRHPQVEDLHHSLLPVAIKAPNSLLKPSGKLLMRVPTAISV